MKQECLAAALNVGTRLARSALWERSQCTWKIILPPEGAPNSRQTNWATAGGSIYQGTSGIGLFLSELAAATGDELILNCAEGALRHAASSIKGVPNHMLGFYAGRSGVAYALARHAILRQNQEFAALAKEILAPVYHNESRDMSLDLIGGAAGAIPTLLVIADLLGLEEARESAVRLGKHLMETATKAPVGWSWRIGTHSHCRNLTGLAHGAAGCAVSLLELYAATSIEIFRFAGARGFDYERTAFDSAENNWRDYRNLELESLLKESNPTAVLAQRLRDGGEFPYYRDRYMSAWCHGAPGIGLSRLRAYELTGNDTMRAEAMAAVRHTAQVSSMPSNYSLCHGAFGNCETLVYASAVFDDPRWGLLVDEVVGNALEKQSRFSRPGITGAFGGGPDPSLMIGEAGIGHFLLKVALPETPSVLLHRPNVTSRQLATGSDHESRDRISLMTAKGTAVCALIQAEYEQHHPRLSAVLKWLSTRGPHYAARADAISAAIGEFPLRDRIRFLAEQLGDMADRELAIDAASLDSAVLEVGSELADESAWQVDKLLRLVDGAAFNDSTALQLAPTVKVFATRFDWNRWIDRVDSRTGPSAEAQAINWVAFMTPSGVEVRRINELVTRILRALVAPMSLTELTKQLFVEIDFGDENFQSIRSKIARQMEYVLASGIVRRDVASLLGATRELPTAAA